jgi:hypothetical protein
VSDVYGAALWSLDFMFTAAVNGVQGVNFHGGGKSPYSPLNDNGTSVTAVGPEFYGLKMFSLLPSGNVFPTVITPTPTINFTAYGVKDTSGGICALLNNKEVNTSVSASVNLGSDVTSVNMISLTGANLYCTNDYTLSGAPINYTGSWNGGVPVVLPVTNGQLTVTVPPITAVLLTPVISPPEIAFSVNNSRLILNWPTNYTGWLLESNSLGLAGANWFPVPGSGNTNSVQITIQPIQNNVFYRLSSP